jgi:signal transduction histidine kinase/ActR/RegA family two-component response regulator
MSETAKDTPTRSRPIRLRDAASTIFALVTLVPFLVLLLLLHRRDILAEGDAQLGLLLALILSVLGFVVLQRLFLQVTRLANAVVAPDDQAGRAVSLGLGRVGGLGQVSEFGQIGSAFARMLDDLKSSTMRLEDLVFKLGALNEVVELAARVSKIDDLLSLVLERSMRTVRATAGSIMLRDTESPKLRVAASRGLPDYALPDGDIDVGTGIAGATAERGDAIVLDDIAGDPRFAAGASGAFVCVPLRVEGRIIGVINLVRRDGGVASPTPFGPTDLQFLTTLMAHVGYSLDNARLLEETRETAARLGTAVRDLQSAQRGLVEGETMRAMGQMASGMAHHLNNLLAVSSGRIQLLLLRAKDTELRRQLDIARQAMDDAADVVRRVLEFSVTQPGVSESRVNINEVVREVIELARPRWHDEAQLRGLTIRIRQELGAIPTVAGDGTGFREVVMNLLLNAVDALPKGGTITVRTWESDGEAYCSIADDGAGMNEAVRRRAFEPFFTTKGPQGVGLGLSVSHAILQRHRGDLALDSAPGRGTVVTFHVPVAGDAVDAETAEIVNADEPIAPRRILLVDDQPEVRAILAESLTAQGHDVEQAGSGRQALERLASGMAADLVLSDLGMPDMTGWEVAEAVNQRWPSLPVGLITGWGARSEGTLDQRRAVAFVLAKPFTLDTLLAAIRRTPRPARS